MKSLLDIQQDIRQLEKSMKEISDDVKNINADIDSLRNASETTELDFDKIEILARQIDFGKHPLDKLKDGRACQVYLEILLNLVRLDMDEEITINRLVFIQWLQIQSRIDWSLEDLYKDCFKTDKKMIFEFLEIIPKKYKDYFLVDALIIANISGEANVALYEYIADIIAILGLTHGEARDLAVISKMALSQSVDGVERECLNMVQDKLEPFSHYLRSGIAQDVIKAMRVIVVALPDRCVKWFEWKVKQFQKVECGDVIATYRKEKRTRGYSYMKQYEYEIEEIMAPVPGTIFRFRDNNTNYGVIAHEKDNKDSIKSWIKTRR